MTPTPPIVDSHAHLDFHKFETDLDQVIERAWQAGLRQIITIGAGRGVEGAHDAVAFAASQPRLWATVGVHPHDADLGVEWQGDPSAEPEPGERAAWERVCELALVRLQALALHPRVVAIGEVGLDFHYDHSPRAFQRELFARFVRLAVELELPLVIHAREAEDEVARILADEGAERVGGVIHCFTGHEGLAEAGLDLGFFFGLTGVLTFPTAKQLRRVVSDLPLDRLLVETDCPYLAPIPYRGKRNEPAYVVEVVRKLAEIKGLEFDPVARATSDNARRLFRIQERERAPRASIAYRFKDSLYLNLSNRCTQACRFCLKHHGHDLAGYELGLSTEPSTDEVLAAAEREIATTPTSEVVFCGIGEPLLRPDVVDGVGRALRAKGGLSVRVNTDGLASLVHGRDVAAELVGAVDAFSISLNAHDAATHHQLCPSRFGPDAFEAVCAFIRRAAELYDDVTATVVHGTGVDEEAARQLATSLGASFRVRG
jgi:TatD DNase family protein